MANSSVINFSKIEQPILRDYKKLYTATGKNYYTTNENDDFFNKIIDAVKNSALHSSILGSIANKLFGKGFTSKNQITTDFINKTKLNTTLMCCINDYLYFGGFSLKVKWNALHTKILTIEHIAFKNIRQGLQEQDEIESTLFYHSSYWDRYNRKNIDVFYKFDTEVSTDDCQIFYFKGYEISDSVYPTPSYYPGIRWILIDGIVSRNILNSLENKLTSSSIISINNGSNPDPDIKAEFEKALSASYAGSENAGKFIVVWSDSVDNAPSITAFPNNDNKDNWDWIKKQTEQEIIFANKIPNPMLVGIKTEGQLGGAAELENSEILFNYNVINPTRNIIMAQFAQLFNLMLVDMSDVQIESYDISFIADTTAAVTTTVGDTTIKSDAISATKPTSSDNVTSNNL